MSPPGVGGLRFALVLDGRPLERWQVRCLDLLEKEATLIALVSAAEGRREARRATASAPMEGFVARVARTEVVHAQVRYANIPTIDAAPDNHDEASFDFALQLGRGSPPDWVCRATRHGVWSFMHDRQDRHPFVREIRLAEDVTQTALIARNAPNGTIITLESGVFRNEKRSYKSTRAQILSSAAEWPARAARRLANLGDPRGAHAEALSASEGEGGPRDRLLPFVAQLAWQRLRFAWHRLFCHAQWNIGVLHAPLHTLLEPGGYRDDAIQWFPVDEHRGFLADPFGVMRDGALNIFCEDFGYESGKGVISSLRYADGRFTTALETVLDLPVHLSYPFLVEDDGTTYAIPESGAANEVALYRIDDFPRGWTKVAVLLEGFAGVDPTVFRHDGRWWLACTSKARDTESALWLWHALALTGPWIPHALNPVKMDVRSARPGGPTFVHAGELYRPAQDCSRTYGWRLAIQRVRTLTPESFAEETAVLLAASPDSPFPAGRHTFSPVGEVVLIDGHRTVFQLPAFLALLRRMATDLGGMLRPRRRASRSSRSCRDRQS